MHLKVKDQVQGQTTTARISKIDYYHFNWLDSYLPDHHVHKASAYGSRVGWTPVHTYIHHVHRNYLK